MAETTTERLCRETGIDGATVQSLGDLSDDQLDTLRRAYSKARDKRAADLNAATDDGLRVIPRLVRPAVKKMLFS